MKNILKLSFLTLLVLVIFAACSNVDKEDESKEDEVFNESVNVPEALLALDDEVELIKIGDEKFTIGDVKEEVLRRHLWGQLFDFAHMQVIINEYPPTKEEIKKEMENDSFVSEKEAEYRAAYKKAILENVDVTDEKLELIKETYFSDESAPTGSENWSEAEWKEFLLSVFPDYYEDNHQIIHDIFEENKDKIEVINEDLKEYINF